MATAVGNAVKQPFVCAPVIGLVLVLIDVSVPSIVSAMLNLIGQTTSGLALFVSGLLLAAHSFRLNLAVSVNSLLKSIGQPAVMLGLALVVGLHNPLASVGAC